MPAIRMDKICKPSFKLEDENQFEIPDETRRGLLRMMLVAEDTYWGLVRSEKALEGQLDYLMGLRAEPYYATDDDWTLLEDA